MKTKLPIALIYLRLLIGFLVLSISILHINNYKTTAIILLIIGFLTDIFDGIIARHFHISTQRIRRLDSTIDQIFFLVVAVATLIQCPDFFKNNTAKLIILLGFEAATYIVSFFKFRKEVATHSIGAKVWSLLLVTALVQIIWQCDSMILFNICFWVGILTRLEIIAIIITLKQWTNDVPTVYHAARLRQNKEIKRHKMLNG